jgi:hypothetical protein
MRIDFLYVPACANYQPAVARVQKVLAPESLQTEVQGVAVSDAEAKAILFPGSSTHSHRW